MGLFNERAVITGNVNVGPRLWIMTLAAPRLAESIAPGQFVHMKIPGMGEHILRRPFSVYAANADKGEIEILYQVVGFGTEHMTGLAPNEVCELIGPVGHGWTPGEDAHRVLLVGGGVGAAPLFMLFEQLCSEGREVDVVLGAQTKDALVCRKRYAAVLVDSPACASNEPACATDDGTFGRAGFCTSLVKEALDAAASAGRPYDYVAVCGPEPLMKIVAGMAEDAGVFCQISMEKRMACGVGACLSCVVETVSGKKRSCVDGPVFNASEVVW